MSNELKQYITIEQAAEILGVSVRTIHRYLDTAVLHRYRKTLGRRTFLKRDEVEKLRDELPQPDPI